MLSVMYLKHSIDKGITRIRRLSICFYSTFDLGVKVNYRNSCEHHRPTFFVQTDCETLQGAIQKTIIRLWCINSSYYYIHVMVYGYILSTGNKLFLSNIWVGGVTMTVSRMTRYCYSFLLDFNCRFQMILFIHLFIFIHLMFMLWIVLYV